jgi:flagellar basal-body rod protein FlgF
LKKVGYNFTSDFGSKFGNSHIVALTKQIALKRDLENTAQNLAEMSTTAAKGHRMVFSELMLKSPDSKKSVSFVQEKGILRDLTQGPAENTGHPLDLYIHGKGYFSLQANDGTIQYTRNGHFHIDGNERLVNEKNMPVLSTTKTPIIIPIAQQPISISPTGRIVGANGTIGNIDVLNFENEQLLVKKGSSLYETTQTPTPSRDFKINSGYLEGSNINAILESTKLITISRDYQQIESLIGKSTENVKETINRVVKV